MRIAICLLLLSFPLLADETKLSPKEAWNRMQQEVRDLRLTARPRPDGSVGIYIEVIRTRASGRQSLEDVLPADGQEPPDGFQRRTADPRSVFPAYVLPDGYVLTRQPPRTDDRGPFSDPQRELDRAGRSNDFGPLADESRGGRRNSFDQNG